MVREENYDVVIVGCGVGGLYTALNLPSEDRILMICKEDIESCDSMLALATGRTGTRVWIS